MKNTKRLALALILASGSMTVMTGSIIAPVAAGFGLRAVFFTGACSSLLWLVMLIFFRKLMARKVT